MNNLPTKKDFFLATPWGIAAGALLLLLLLLLPSLLSSLLLSIRDCSVVPSDCDNDVAIADEDVFWLNNDPKMLVRALTWVGGFRLLLLSLPSWLLLLLLLLLALPLLLLILPPLLPLLLALELSNILPFLNLAKSPGPKVVDRILPFVAVAGEVVSSKVSSSDSSSLSSINTYYTW